MRSRSCILPLIALLGALANATTAAAAQEVQDPSDWQLCRQEARKVERQQGLPPLLLEAIAQVESGRWRKTEAASAGWPWTVTAGGPGQFLPSRRAAIAQVEALRAQGRRNIDVGCMQINLRYHPEAFESLADAFEPAANLRYAATFLTELRARYGSWTAAIGRYHSATPRFSGPYRLKVFRAWRAARHAERRAQLAARAEARSRAVAVAGN